MTAQAKMAGTVACDLATGDDSSRGKQRRELAEPGVAEPGVANPRPDLDPNKPINPVSGSFSLESRWVVSKPKLLLIFKF